MKVNMKEEKNVTEGNMDDRVDLIDTFKRVTINNTTVARISTWKSGLAFRRTRWSHDKDTADQIGPGERCMWHSQIDRSQMSRDPGFQT